MLHRYAEWVRRTQGRSAQCSPALAVLGFLLFAGITCYIYREVILKTVEVMIVSMVAIALTAVFIAIGARAIRVYRAQGRLLRVEAPAYADEDEPDTWTKAPTSMADEEAISREAEWLAGGVELAFGPDGSLKAKK